MISYLTHQTINTWFGRSIKILDQTIPLSPAASVPAEKTIVKIDAKSIKQVSFSTHRNKEIL